MPFIIFLLAVLGVLETFEVFCRWYEGLEPQKSQFYDLKIYLKVSNEDNIPFTNIVQMH